MCVLTVRYSECSFYTFTNIIMTKTLIIKTNDNIIHIKLLIIYRLLNYNVDKSVREKHQSRLIGDSSGI